MHEQQCENVCACLNRFFCGPNAKKSAALAKQQKKRPRGDGKSKSKSVGGKAAAAGSGSEEDSSDGSNSAEEDEDGDEGVSVKPDPMALANVLALRFYISTTGRLLPPTRLTKKAACPRLCAHVRSLA